MESFRGEKYQNYLWDLFGLCVNEAYCYHFIQESIHKSTMTQGGLEHVTKDVDEPLAVLMTRLGQVPQLLSVSHAAMIR